MKKKRVKLPRVNAPHDCAILSVDAAGTSGWAIWDRGRLIDFGECDVFGDEPARILERFAKLPAPRVIVVERPFLVRSSNDTGMGAADKIWRERAARMRIKSVRVYPASWRAVTLPKGNASAKRETVRPVELMTAKIVVSQHIPADTCHPRVGDDSAPAILIGQWATCAGELVKVLPKPKKPKFIRGDSIKFGRFAMRSKPKKRIERATDGDQHYVGTWLVIDGEVAKRDAPITPAQLETAQIELGYGRFDASTTRYAPEATALIPYRATSADIEAGWSLVADQVERLMKKASAA